MTYRIAAVMTCHNRSEQTVACLEALRDQHSADADIRAVVVDDGSTDGTTSAIYESFPEATVLQGDGNLYWAPGMRMALQHAFEGDYDFYLWLNDDTILDPDAVSTLLRTREELLQGGSEEVLVVGATRDPDTGVTTYGGRFRPSTWRRHHFVNTNSSTQPQRIETMNGNVVLVPRAVARVVGNISEFRHSFGDEDYGLRANQAGFEVWLAPGTVATCARNPAPVYGRRPLLEDIRNLWSIKGLWPSDWATFLRRWGGPLWPLFFVSPYLRRIVRVIDAHIRKTKAT